LVRIAALIAVLAVCPGHLARATDSANWELVVRAFGGARSGETKTFWVGLRNASKVERAFCMLGVYYEFDRTDGATEGRFSDAHPGGGSPHPCAAPVSTLVLPGQTHFAVATPSLPPQAVKGSLRFGMTASEACTSEPCTLAERIDLRELRAAH
jgi:hypothetical protein